MNTPFRGSDLYLFEVLQNAVRRLVLLLGRVRAERSGRVVHKLSCTNQKIQVDDGALQVLDAESFHHFIMAGPSMHFHRCFEPNQRGLAVKHDGRFPPKIGPIQNSRLFFFNKQVPRKDSQREK